MPSTSLVWHKAAPESFIECGYTLLLMGLQQTADVLNRNAAALHLIIFTTIAAPYLVAAAAAAANFSGTAAAAARSTPTPSVSPYYTVRVNNECIIFI
jgi:hypothetical protein